MEKIMHALPVLAKGSTGDPVRRVQALINVAGVHPVKVDGVYGDRTAAGVRAVQAAHKLTVDGKAGPHTWAVLLTGADL